jgi:hypothetical protein
MQMLAAGGLPALADPPGSPRHRAPDASNPRGYFELDAVRTLRSGAPWLDQAEGHVVKVIAPLIPLLPPGRTYRAVLIRRDLDEVIASQATMLRMQNRPVGDPSRLRLAFERALAQAAVWLARHSVPTLSLDHHRLLADPEAEATRLKDFFLDSGVSLQVPPMSAAVDPALHRSLPPDRPLR